MLGTWIIYPTIVPQIVHNSCHLFSSSHDTRFSEVFRKPNHQQTGRLCSILSFVFNNPQPNLFQRVTMSPCNNGIPMGAAIWFTVRLKCCRNWTAGVSNPAGSNTQSFWHSSMSDNFGLKYTHFVTKIINKSFDIDKLVDKGVWLWSENFICVINIW